MKAAKLNEIGAAALARTLARREVTAERVARACLERIEEREPEVGAWAFVDADAVLNAAREIDAGPWRGELHGLPIGVKDIIDTVDMPTAYGSALYRGHRPPWDAACVALAREAGGLILGKTVTTEFATYHPGKTANPHALDRTPGGSSSGSAAAVADGMVPLAFGTQTAGSVIRPAAYCGVVGFKPSYAMIPRAGVKPVAESLDTIGVFAREVEDVALFAGVMAGRRWELRDDLPPVRIGLCQTNEWDAALPETQAMLVLAGRSLEARGWRLGETVLPPQYARLAAVQARIMAFEAARSLAWERLDHEDELSPELLRLIEDGVAQGGDVHDADMSAARAAVGKLPEVFSDVDLLLAPSTPGEAPLGLNATGNPVFCRVWTLLGVPCVHLPIGRGPAGLPLGLQLIARPGADGALLSYAAHVLRDLRV